MEFRTLEEYPNYEIYEDGTIIRKAHKKKLNLSRRVIKHTPMSNGYETVSLRDKEGNVHRWYVHRIIYVAFNGEIPKGYEIDHTDGNRANCHYTNLRLVSHKENCSNPISMERYKMANAIEKGKFHIDALKKGKNTTDLEVLGRYFVLSPTAEMGAYAFMLEGKVGYPRAVRIVRMARGIRGDGA